MSPGSSTAKWDGAEEGGAEPFIRDFRFEELWSGGLGTLSKSTFEGRLKRREEEAKARLPELAVCESFAI
jgi:hypothetical protein